MQRLLLFRRQFGRQIRYHHIVAGQHAVLGTHLVQLPAPRIDDVHPFGLLDGADIPHADDDAGKPYAHLVARPVQLRVVGARCHDVRRAVPRNGSRYQRPHQ